jgi:hypothetical protein
MGWKGGKTLKNILYATTFAMAGFLPGCEKEPPIEPSKDTIPPKIYIYSPLERKVYDSNTILFHWTIVEENFKSASYSLDYEQTKTSITKKSGSDTLRLVNGNYNLTTYADDSSNNVTRKIVNFYVKALRIINPFISPGNGAEYNALSKKEDRDAYILAKLKEDWVNTILSSTNPPWVCGHYSMQLFVNSNYLGEDVYTLWPQWGDHLLYNGYNGREPQKIYENHGTLADMGKLKIPINIVTIKDTSHFSSSFGHAMNWVVTGDDLRKWGDLDIIEPQSDATNVQIGGGNLPKNCDLVIIGYNYIIEDKIIGNYLWYVPLEKFKIENGVPILIWENTDPDFIIKKQRGK